MSFRLLLPADRPAAEGTDPLPGALVLGLSDRLRRGRAGAQVGRSQDALRMIEQIARAATDPESDQEAEESAYTELTEFVRVAVLLLREESLARSSR
jgi:uncharacterized protein